jgi:hypothetical protein
MPQPARSSEPGQSDRFVGLEHSDYVKISANHLKRSLVSGGLWKTYLGTLHFANYWLELLPRDLGRERILSAPGGEASLQPTVMLAGEVDQVARS